MRMVRLGDCDRVSRARNKGFREGVNIQGTQAYKQDVGGLVKGGADRIVFVGRQVIKVGCHDEAVRRRRAGEMQARAYGSY